MADFGRVLAALDSVSPGLNALPRYLAQRGRVADDVLEADPIGAGILALLTEAGGEWSGTAGALLARLQPQTPSREWPRTGRGLVA